MNEKFKAMLDEEFSEVMNSDRADSALETAIRVVDVLKRFDEKYNPYATSEISILAEASELLEMMQADPEQLFQSLADVESSGGSK